MTRAEKIKELLSDGQWHLSRGIKQKVSSPAPLLCEMRNKGVIESRPVPGSNRFEYRLKNGHANGNGQHAAVSPGATDEHVYAGDSIRLAALLMKQSTTEFIAAAAHNAAAQTIALAQKAMT